MFEVGLPLGVAILVIGAGLARWFNRAEFAGGMLPRVAAVAEGILALACTALALESVLDGYIYLGRYAKPTVCKIRGVIGNVLVFVLSVSCAIIFAVMAVRDWVGL